MTPTLLIPGLACSAALFRDQIGALNAFGPVHIADHRGADTVAELAAGILKTAPSHFRLCGLSMGGYIAFEIWRQAPERVTHMALLDTSARPDTPEGTQKRKDAIALCRKGQYLRVIKEGIPNLLTEEHVRTAAMRERVLEMAEHCGVQGYISQQMANASRPDSRPTLSTITVPTLVLVGEHDILTPEALAVEMVEGIGEHAELEVLQQAAHLTPLEQPLAVRAALTEFFARYP